MKNKTFTFSPRNRMNGGKAITTSYTYALDSNMLHVKQSYIYQSRTEIKVH